MTLMQAFGTNILFGIYDNGEKAIESLLAVLRSCRDVAPAGPMKPRRCCNGWSGETWCRLVRVVWQRM